MNIKAVIMYSIEKEPGWERHIADERSYIPQTLGHVWFAVEDQFFSRISKHFTSFTLCTTTKLLEYRDDGIQTGPNHEIICNFVSDISISWSNRVN